MVVLLCTTDALRLSPGARARKPDVGIFKVVSEAFRSTRRRSDTEAASRLDLPEGLVKPGLEVSDWERLRMRWMSQKPGLLPSAWSGAGSSAERHCEVSLA